MYSKLRGSTNTKVKCDGAVCDPAFEGQPKDAFLAASAPEPVKSKISDEAAAVLNSRVFEDPDGSPHASPQGAPFYVHDPDQPRPFTGIDYLGLGYDYAYGNPMGDPITQIDPGFRAPVAHLDFSSEFGPVERTRDDHHLRPLGAYSYPQYSCMKTESSVSQSTTKDYSKSLATDCSMAASLSAAGVGSAGFSFSTAAKEFKNTVVGSKSEKYVMTSYCLQFVAGFIEGNHVPSAVPYYKNETFYLPTVASVEAITDEVRKIWHGFFEQFGTHYIHKVWLGGKMVHQMTISSDSVTSMKQKGIDIKEQVEVSLSGYGSSASASVGRGKTQDSAAADALANSDKEVKLFVFGGLPPKMDAHDTASFGAWAETVPDRPMPVRYELAPQSRFPFMDTPSYDIMLKDYMEKGSVYDDSIGKIAADAALSGIFKKQEKARNKLFPGESLDSGDQLISSNGGVVLRVQDDGNVVTYMTGMTESNTRPTWASFTDPLSYGDYIQQNSGGSGSGCENPLNGHPHCKSFCARRPIPATLPDGSDSLVEQENKCTYRLKFEIDGEGQGDLRLYAVNEDGVQAENWFYAVGLFECTQQILGYVALENDGTLQIYDKDGDRLWTTGATREGRPYYSWSMADVENKNLNHCVGGGATDPSECPNWGLIHPSYYGGLDNMEAKIKEALEYNLPNCAGHHKQY